MLLISAIMSHEDVFADVLCDGGLMELHVGFFFFRSTEIKNNIKTQRNTRDVSVEFLKTLFWLSMLSQLFLTPPAWKHPSTKVGKRLDQREYVRSD